MNKITQIYPKVRFPFSKIIGEAEAKGAYYRIVCITDADPLSGAKLIAPIGLHLIYRFILFMRYSFLTKDQDRYLLVDTKKGTFRKMIIQDLYDRIYKEIKDMPLCYNDGITEPDDEGSFIEGESHFKDHVLEKISKLLEKENEKTMDTKRSN